MKKETILKTLLAALPVLAIGLATTVDSVTVFDTISGKTIHGSYFSILPVGSMQICAPLAALLTIVILILAILYLIKKKEDLATWVKWLSFVAATAAVLPVVIQGPILVVPHVGVPLFLAGEWVVSYMLTFKQKEKEPAKLKGHYKKKK